MVTVGGSSFAAARAVYQIFSLRCASRARPFLRPNRGVEGEVRLSSSAAGGGGSAREQLHAYSAPATAVSI